MNRRISFIGAGNMAEAIILSIIKSKLIPPENIYISDINQDRLNYIKSKTNVNIQKNNFEAFEKGDFVFLAVKPQFMEQAVNEIFVNKNSDYDISSKKTILSIAAGMKLSKIKKLFMLKNLFFVRIMPNTPALVSAGVSAFYADKDLPLENLKIVKEIISTFGKFIVLDEEDSLDAVTAVSGSGPAYFFYFFESLMKSAQELGFEKEKAHLLVKETIKGSLKLLEETQIEAETLRDNVTSKGGTTEAALKVLKEKKFQEIVTDAVNMAFKRAREISNL